MSLITPDSIDALLDAGQIEHWVAGKWYRIRRNGPANEQGIHVAIDHLGGFKECFCIAPKAFEQAGFTALSPQSFRQVGEKSLAEVGYTLA